MTPDICKYCGVLDPWHAVPCHCRQTGSRSLSEGMVARLRRLAREMRVEEAPRGK